MAKPLLGMRVVRGPDWLPFCNDDGGQGGVGTVIEIIPGANCEDGNEKASTAAIASGGVASVQDGQVMVHWDITGRKGTYNCGAEGSYELRILDTTPAGICHAGVSCTECGQQEIAGIRWQCRECPDSNLCSDCYMRSEHDIDHRFCAIAQPGAASFFAARRNSSKCVMARGIFPRSTVSLLNHDDHDRFGTVSKLSSAIPANSRGMVAVEWQNGVHEVHSLGHQGKVQLKCVKHSDGGCYYAYHQPVLGILNPEEIRLMQRVGDLIQVQKMDQDIFEEFQDEVDGHRCQVNNFLSEIGEIMFIDRTREGANVFFPSRLEMFVFHPAVCAEVPLFQVDQRVTVTTAVPELRKMMKSLGGWSEKTEIAVGMEGVVTEMRHDFGVMVQFDKQPVCLHPACLVLTKDYVPGKHSVRSSASTPVELPNLLLADSDSSDNSLSMGAHGNQGELSVDMFREGTADLHGGNFEWESWLRSLLDPGNQNSLSSELIAASMDMVTDVVPAFPVLKAIVDRNPGRLEEVLQKNSAAVNENIGDADFTSMYAAVDVGRADLIELLAQYGGNVMATDTESMTPLHDAARKDRTEVIDCLIRLGARLDQPGHEGNFPLHTACLHDRLASAKILVRQHKANGLDLDCVNAGGLTPLHVALMNDHDDIVRLLVENGASIELQSLVTDFNACQIAALENSKRSLAVLLERAPRMIHSPRDPANGSALIHLVALKNHLASLLVLLNNDECDIDMKNAIQGTALRSATATGAKSCVEHLVGHGASLSAVDEDGNSMLHIALYRQHHAEEGDTAALLDGACQLSGPSPLIDAIEERMTFSTACGNRMAAIACFFAQQGCDISRRNNLGKPAVKYSHGTKMESLIRKYYQPPRHSTFPGSMKLVRSQPATASNDLSGNSEPPVIDLQSAGRRSARTVIDEDCEEPSPPTTPRELPRQPISPRSPHHRGDMKCVRRCGNMASVTFLPCGHKLTCRDCCFHYRQCRACRKEIERRQDNGRDLQPNQSQIALLSSLPTDKRSPGLKMAARFPGQNCSPASSGRVSSPEASGHHAGSASASTITQQPVDMNIHSKEADYLKMTSKLICSTEGDQSIRRSTERGSTSTIPLSTPSTDESDRNKLNVDSSDSRGAKNVIQGSMVASLLQPDGQPAVKSPGFQIPSHSTSSQMANPISTRPHYDNCVQTLVNAVSAGNTSRAERLLQRFGDHVNDKTHPNENTCMHEAVHLGNVAMVELVARYGGRVDITNARGDMPLHVACISNSFWVIPCLMRHGAKLDVFGQGGSMPLHTACGKGHVDCVKELLRQHQLTGVDCDMPDAVGYTPLQRAARSDHHEVVRLMLEAGAGLYSIGPEGHNAVQIAVSCDSLQTLLVMVDHFPDAIRRQCTFDEGDSLQHLAAHCNSTQCLRYLLSQSDCDIELRNDLQATPLREAVVKGAIGAVEILIGFGSKLDVEDDSGNSLLHCAIYKFLKSEKGTGTGEQFCNIKTDQSLNAPLLCEIVAKMPFTKDTSQRMAAIACFLSQLGGNLSYCNHQAITPMEMADGDLLALLIEYHKPPGASTFPGSYAGERAAAQTNPDQPSENVTQSNSAQSESQLLAHISHNVLLGNLTGPQLSESDVNRNSATGPRPASVSDAAAQFRNSPVISKISTEVRARRNADIGPCREEDNATLPNQTQSTGQNCSPASSGRVSSPEASGHHAGSASASTITQQPVDMNIHSKEADYLKMTSKLICSTEGDQSIRRSTERGSTSTIPLSTPSTDESDRNKLNVDSSDSRGAKNVIQGSMVASLLQPDGQPAVKSPGFQIPSHSTSSQMANPISTRPHYDNCVQTLVNAVSAGNTSRAERLLQRFGDHVNDKTHPNENTCMHEAVHLGNVAMVELVARYGGRVDITNARGDMPLHVACISNSFWVIPCLMRHGAKLDVFGQGGSMPLHTACGKGHVDCVKELLRQHQLTGVDCDMPDAVGYTPLQRAARSDHHEVVRLMLEAGAGLYSIGPEGHNAVQIAVSCDSLQTLLVMVDHFPDAIRRQCTFDEGDSLQHLAAHCNSTQCLRYLLSQSDCDIELRNDLQATPLCEAVVKGAIGAVEILIGFGSKLDVEDDGGNSLLHCAIYKFLKSEKGTGTGEQFCNIKTDQSLNAPLLCEIVAKMPFTKDTSQRMAAIACFLSQLGGNLSYCNHQAITPMEMADGDLLALLIEYHKPPGASTFPGSYAGERAAAQTNPDQPSENVTQSNSAQSESQLLAHISHNVLLGNLTGPQLSESDVNRNSATGPRPASVSDTAAQFRNSPVISKISTEVRARRNADIGPCREEDNATLPNQTQLTVPAVATTQAGSNHPIVDTNSSSNPATGKYHYSVPGDGSPVDSILHAIANRDGPRLEAMLKLHKAHVNDLVSFQGRKITCMHAAVHTGIVSIVELVAAHGGRVDIPDNVGDRPLHDAVLKGSAVLVKCLISLGARLDEYGETGVLPIHVACIDGNLEVVKELIRQHKSAGLDIDSRSLLGNTALWCAVDNHNTMVIQLLLDAGASLMLRSEANQRTACQRAVVDNCYKSLSVMVEYCPSVINEDKTLADNFSLLHLAAHYNAVECLECLLKWADCDIEARDCLNATPLRPAVASGCVECVEQLVAYGAKINVEDIKGDSLLHVALCMHHNLCYGDEKLPRIANVSSKTAVYAPRISQILASMPFSDEQQNRMAAIACFLVQQGCGLSYCNYNGVTALEYCSDDRLMCLVWQHHSSARSSDFQGSKANLRVRRISSEPERAQLCHQPTHPAKKNIHKESVDYGDSSSGDNEEFSVIEHSLKKQSQNIVVATGHKL